MLYAQLILNIALTLMPPQGLSYGSSSFDVTYGSETIDVFAYKPRTPRPKGILFVLHGTLRNASEYRDDAREMADRLNVIVLTPHFDAQRFPSRRYQRGGILNEDGTLAEESKRTYAFLPEVVRQVEKKEGRKLNFSVIGHSAGGQFVIRCAAFSNIGATRLIAANPGSLVFPTRDRPFGYGFGSLPAAASDDQAIQRYLAQPLTIFCGSADNGPDDYFDDSEEAMKQGPGRYQRGKACYEAGKTLAASRGWKFNWKFVEAPGIPHDHTMMFNHENAFEAIFGFKQRSFEPN